MSLTSQGTLAIKYLNTSNIQGMYRTIKASFDNSNVFINNLIADIAQINSVYANILTDRQYGYNTSIAPIDISQQLNDLQTNLKYMTDKFSLSLFDIYFELYRLAEIAARATIEIENNIKPGAGTQLYLTLLQTKLCTNRSDSTTSIYHERENPLDMCSNFKDKSSATFDDVQNVITVIITCLQELAIDIDGFDAKITANTNLMNQGINVGLQLAAKNLIIFYNSIYKKYTKTHKEIAILYFYVKEKNSSRIN